MNFQYFAKQLLFNSSIKKDEPGGTPILVQIARIGITVGIAVMLISVSVVTGFQHAIRECMC